MSRPGDYYNNCFFKNCIFSIAFKMLSFFPDFFCSFHKIFRHAPKYIRTCRKITYNKSDSKEGAVYFQDSPFPQIPVLKSIGYSQSASLLHFIIWWSCYSYTYYCSFPLLSQLPLHILPKQVLH